MILSDLKSLPVKDFGCCRDPFYRPTSVSCFREQDQLARNCGRTGKDPDRFALSDSFTPPGGLAFRKRAPPLGSVC